MRSRSSYTILEIDDLQHPEVLCGNSGISSSIELHKYDDIPAFLKGNPYVIQGYRVSLPGYLCLRSLFSWSNESINIWSHVLGCLIIFFLMIYDNIIGIPSLHGTKTDHVIVTIGLLCFQFCLLSSAGYHLFMCHSEKASERWLALDLNGILVGLLGCYLPGVHYAFFCMSVWRDIYLVSICFLFGGLFCLQMKPKFLTTRYYRLRIILYVLICAYGIIPSLHWVWLSGGVSNPIVKFFFPKVVVEYLLAILAFTFYISKIPERFSPGTFDFIGSSHQLWHVVILIAFLYWHYAGKQILAYRISNQCTYP